CTEAEELHQHQLEMKKTEIELCKVDIEVLDKKTVLDLSEPSDPQLYNVMD
ncbi:hypothetical protein PAXRUDRAFT_153422, partial [Paxillus rubicundulus Ve08.2h10]